MSILGRRLARLWVCLIVLASVPGWALDVTLSRSGSGTVINTQPATIVTITIRFTESVSDFTTGDLGLTGGGVLGPVTGSGTTYTATWTPPASAEGTVEFTVDTGAATVGAVGNSPASPLTIVYDTQVPDLQVTTPAITSVTLSSTPVRVDGTVDDPAATVRVRRGAEVLATTTGLNWLADLTLADGTHALSIVATDVNGNSDTITRSITVDTEGPIVTWRDAATVYTRSGVDVTLTLDYADETTGVSLISLTDSDITLTPGTTGALVSVSGSDLALRSILVSGLVDEGTTVSVAVGDQTARDEVDNLAEAPSGTITIVVDDTAAVMTPVPNSTATTSAATFPVSLTFNEPLRQAPVLTLVNAHVSGSAVSSGGNTVWTFTIAPAALGAVQLTRVEAIDRAGNQTVSNDAVVLVTAVAAPVGTPAPGALPQGITPGGGGCGGGATGMLCAMLGFLGLRSARRRRSDP